MGEYGGVISIGQAGEYDKERVKMALQGKLMCGEDGHGFIYEDAPKEECERYILDVVDNWVWNSLNFAAHGRAMEQLMKNHRFPMHEYFREYVGLVNEENRKYRDYLTEGDLEELAEEIEKIEGGDDE